MNIVRQTWNEKADEWAGFARDRNSYWARRLQTVSTVARKHAPPGRALDVGCGPGLLCRLLAAAGFEVHGVDISENMIREARELLRECIEDVGGHLHHCPDGILPFDPAVDRFNLITAIGVLEYIADRKTYVKRLTDLLESGGCLILGNTNNISLYITLSVGSRILRFWPTRKWYDTIRNLARTGIWSGGHIDYQKADKIYSANALDQLAVNLGLEVVDGFDLYFFSWLDRDPLHRGKLGQRLARRWGWNHFGVYRKPVQNVKLREINVLPTRD
jgi:2-polyprenyl-3-methyl-5-hydroxy-6-metoxy-1,4-benzoquinol methylase